MAKRVEAKVVENYENLLLDVINNESSYYKEIFEYYKSLKYSTKVAIVLTYFVYSDRNIQKMLRYDDSLKVQETTGRYLDKVVYTYDGMIDKLYDLLCAAYDNLKEKETYLLVKQIADNAANLVSIKYMREKYGDDFNSSRSPAVLDGLSYGTAFNCMSFDEDGVDDIGAISYCSAAPSVETGAMKSSKNLNTVASKAGGQGLFGSQSIRAMNSVSSNTVGANVNFASTVPFGGRGIFGGLFKKDAFRYDSYESIKEIGFQDALSNPTSAFRMTVNTASMGVILNNLRKHSAINKDMVRIEELLNYFKYDLKHPTDKMFEINTEIANKPNSKNKLLFVGVQGKKEVKSKQNIVILLDVSGSMSSHNDETQAVIATIVSKLKAGDRLSFVTYSSKDEVIYDGKVISDEKDKENILSRLYAIDIDGCTNGSAGIEKAYEIGAKYYDKDGNNRVILITDGDLNFGITKNDDLEKFILEKKKKGLFLSVVGTGLYNYQDDKLETLSKNGNGTYCVCNNLVDVEDNLNENYDGFINAIAKDVKAEVEFNPSVVKSYRLLGYENRTITHAEFKDDTVISEPFGSDTCGVALYEVEMAEEKPVSDLKYQRLAEGTDEICTVKVRYKGLLDDKSTEILEVVKNEISDMSENLKLAWCIYAIGEKLRNSKYVTKDDEWLLDFVKGSENFKVLRELNRYRLDLFRELAETFE